MPIPVIIPNGVYVRLIWTLGGSTQMINVLGGQVAGGFTSNQAVANALGTAIKSALGSSGLGAKLGPNTVLQNVGLRDMRTANNAEYLDSGASVVGTATGDALPPGTAFVVTLRTAKSGQSFRGRVYLGGFTEEWNATNGQADPTVGTTAVAFITACASAMNASGITHAVLSRPAPQVQTTIVYTYSDGSSNTVTHLQHSRVGQTTPVTLVQARNNLWDVQRRRDAPGKQSSLIFNGNAVASEVLNQV